MNKLSIEKRAQIIGMLVEGNSMRVVSRMADCSINTVTKLLVDVGLACWIYQHRTLRDLPCKRIQCDEIWSFCYAKEKNVPKDHRGELGYGDVYTWTAMCADTKLVPSFLVGRRDSEYAHLFIKDLESRLKNRVQITTDGHKVYLDAIEAAFGGETDYAMLVKIYESVPAEDQRKYSPVECTGADRKCISGNPNEMYVSTSYIERQNLTMRMSMRRFTRLTNGFSKKIENLECAVALHFMYYNFARVHKTLRVTPAMEAGIADHVWTLGEIVILVSNVRLETCM
jgi:IS1 family transposase